MKKQVKPIIAANKARVKMTVIHFETESSNEALQENIKSVVTALTKALSPQQRIVTSTASRLDDDIRDEEKMDSVEAEVDDENLDVDSESTSEVLNEQQTQKAKPKQLPKGRPPKAIDLDLISGEKTLKAFLDEKKPEGDNKRYLAIAYWLKTFREISEVNMDHAYTCYRHMGWQVPKDASGPYRSMKSPRYGWVAAGKQKGSYVVNHLGENEIEKLGKSA